MAAGTYCRICTYGVRTFLGVFCSQPVAAAANFERVDHTQNLKFNKRQQLCACSRADFRTFHKNTIFVLKELLESVGVKHPSELNRRHIVRRLSESEILLADQIYPRAEKGELLKKGKKTIADPRINVYWNKVNTKSFNYDTRSI